MYYMGPLCQELHTPATPKLFSIFFRCNPIGGSQGYILTNPGSGSLKQYNKQKN